jgi:hypothetical protein
MGPVGEGFGTALIIMIIICGGLFYGLFRGLEWLVTDDSIRSNHRLTPQLELIIDSGRVDTMFVYKQEGK